MNGANSQPTSNRPLPTDALAGRPRRRLDIAVDFDGVLFDHIPYVLRGFRDAHGIDLEAEGLQFWDFFQYRAVRERDLSWSCVRDVLHKIETDPAVHRMPPRDLNARGVLEAWREAGHKISIVTARDESSRAVTELFLRTHRIPHDELRMNVFRKVGYDVLVDDAPHNVLMAAADGGLALLMDHPYNRDVPTHSNPLRVQDWLEVAAAVERHVHRSQAPSSTLTPLSAVQHSLLAPELTVAALVA